VAAKKEAARIEALRHKSATFIQVLTGAALLAKPNRSHTTVATTAVVCVCVCVCPVEPKLCERFCFFLHAAPSSYVCVCVPLCLSPPNYTGHVPVPRGAARDARSPRGPAGGRAPAPHPPRPVRPQDPAHRASHLVRVLPPSLRPHCEGTQDPRFYFFLLLLSLTKDVSARHAWHRLNFP